MDDRKAAELIGVIPGPPHTIGDQPGAGAPNYGVGRSFFMKVTNLTGPSRACKVTRPVIETDLSDESIGYILAHARWGNLINYSHPTNWPLPRNAFDIDLTATGNHDEEATFVCILITDDNAWFQDDRFLAITGGDATSAAYLYEPNLHGTGDPTKKVATFKVQPGLPFVSFNLGVVIRQYDANGNEQLSYDFIDPKIKNDG